MATLKKGAKGGEVKKLQESLNKALKPSPKLKASGNFDDTTVDAVKRFQKKAGLTADGVAGTKVTAMLKLFITGVKWPHGDTSKQHKDMEKEFDDGVKAADDVETKFDDAGILCEDAATLLADTWNKIDRAVDAMCADYRKQIKMLDQLKGLETEFDACGKRGDVLRQQELVAEAGKLKKKAAEQYDTIGEALSDTARKDWTAVEKALKDIGKFKLTA